ncbi:MAG: NAD-dependent epimerase/dehydratase family protein, partial [Parvularculaceae bacterium]|nr:NAD-dependent epimerase/dehydratase family protein [Parvularculaceae bacterium]
MARFLVTGANGLLGRAVLAAMTEAGDEPIALCRTRPAAKVDWIAADLSAPLRIEALPARIDGVAHLAQSDRFNAFPDGAADVFAVNVASLAA